jgi:hypothetical protein
MPWLPEPHWGDVTTMLALLYQLSGSEEIENPGGPAATPSKCFLQNGRDCGAGKSHFTTLGLS